MLLYLLTLLYMNMQYMFFIATLMYMNMKYMIFIATTVYEYAIHDIY